MMDLKTDGRPQAALRRAQFLLATEALASVFQARQPADQILQSLFRAHRECGGRDRALVGELVYGVLRDGQRLLALAGSDARTLCALRALEQGLVTAPQLQDWGVSDAGALATRLQDLPALTLAQQLNVPEPLYENWCDQYGAADAEALARALNRPAPVDLRINPLQGTREAIAARLAAEGYPPALTPRSPLGLRLGQRLPLQNLAVYREGAVEPQDEGSQLIALLAGARPGQTVVDFCAGAGGKTLALAAQMQDRGRLIACDVSASRLQRLSPRLARTGLQCVETLPLEHEADPVLAPLANLCDVVLVDAPCSASGTWRRNPELRLRPVDLVALPAQQRAILDAAAALVRPGGRLVYATCSLFREENEQVVAAFLSAHPQFEPEDAGALLQAQGADYAGAVLQLLPHRDGTDGFFAAAMRRRN